MDSTVIAANMNTEYFRDLAVGIGALLTALSLFAAGVIFLWKREWRTRLQISVGIEAFRKMGKSFLIEPVCVIVNKGLLRCYIYKLDFSVRYLRSGDELKKGDDEILGATVFPHQAVKIQFVKPAWVWSYVEAGIELKFSHVTHIPEDAVAILVWMKLYHKKGREDDFFSTQKIFIIEGDKLIERSGVAAA
jgi:hypothetical protein